MNLTIDNIDNGIIDILKKKYKVDIYWESSLHYSTIIDKNELKNNINFDYKYTNDVIDTYILFNEKIYRCDIDILNLIIKIIVLKKKIPKKQYIEKYSFIDTINYYLGIKKDSVIISENIDKLTNKLIHSSIKYVYYKIHKDIINYYSILN